MWEQAPGLHVEVFERIAGVGAEQGGGEALGKLNEVLQDVKRNELAISGHRARSTDSTRFSQSPRRRRNAPGGSVHVLLLRKKVEETEILETPDEDKGGEEQERERGRRNKDR